MVKEYAKYLIDECVKSIINGSDRYVEIDFTINCLEVVLDTEFTKEQWETAFNIINKYVESKMHE
jgi:hypothetical protein